MVLLQNLHYFLVDDTVEVREVKTMNDGRDPFPLLLNRHRLPRSDNSLKGIGEEVEVRQRICLSGLSQTDCSLSQDYYTARDFFIGSTINVFGRNFLIYDCDGYTRTFYKKYFDRAMDAIDLAPPPPPPVKNKIPPHTGFGSEEDSLGSVNRLAPCPPRRDFVKMMKNEGKVCLLCVLEG